MATKNKEKYVYQEEEVEEYTQEKQDLVTNQIIPHIKNNSSTTIKCRFNEDFWIYFTIEKAKDRQIVINLKLNHIKSGHSETLGKSQLHKDTGNIYEWVLNTVSMPNYHSWR